MLLYSLGIDFKSMPPCKRVILNKAHRTRYFAHVIKNASDNFIEKPSDGWTINEKNEMEIEYFSGDSYPDSIANIECDEQCDEDNEALYSSSDDDESDISDDEWLPKK